MSTVTFVCAFCQRSTTKNLRPNRHQQFCSLKCWGRSRTATRTCKDCGGPVSTARTNRCLACNVARMKREALGEVGRKGVCQDCGGPTVSRRTLRCRACYYAHQGLGLVPTAHPTSLDIAWAAGIFEGEGSCYPDKRSDTARCQVAQNDVWLLNRLKALFGGSVQTRRGRSGFNRAAHTFAWYASGPRARGFLMTIYAFLSPRRQAQVRRTLRIDAS